MKKKLFNLLTLVSVMLIGGANSAWAQTDVTAVWFNATDTTIATITSETDPEINDKFSVKGATVATDPVVFSLNKTRSGVSVSGQSETMTVTNIAVPANTEVTNSTEMISFTLTPEAGITLSPTSITFYAGIQSFGDKKDNSKNKYVNYVVYSGSSVVVERTDIQLGRNDSGTGITPVSIDLSDVSCDAQNSLTIKLFLKGYNNSSSKNILLGDITVKGEVTGTVQEVNKYTVTTTVMPENSGTVTIAPSAESYNEGSDVTLTAAASVGYVFENWSDGENILGTDTKYTITSISKDENIIANFKALPVITFTANEENIEGVDVVYNTYNNGETITIPVNTKLYVEGKTLTGWNDGEKTYKPGDTYTINGDATLNGVFEDNTFDIAKPEGDVTVRWDFDTSTNGVTIHSEGNNRPSDIYVAQATLNGKTIDLKMEIDGSNGKFFTSGSETAQVRGAVLTIPAATGCTISFYAKDNINVLTIDGESVKPEGTAWAYTYKGSNSPIEITTSESATYYKYIEVVYKKAATYTLTTEDTDFYSLYLDYAATIPAGVTAYTGVLNAEETTLTVTPVEGNVLPAGCAVLVKSDAAGEFTFEEAETEAPAVTANDLKGVTEETAAEPLAEGKTVLTLGQLNGETGFRNPANGKVQANKAYLLVNSVSAAKGIKIVAGGNTTGITEINAGNAVDNAPAYNVAGQRVTEAAKGLIIKNGKKFMNK